MLQIIYLATEFSLLNSLMIHVVGNITIVLAAITVVTQVHEWITLLTIILWQKEKSLG